MKQKYILNSSFLYLSLLLYNEKTMWGENGMGTGFQNWKLAKLGAEILSNSGRLGIYMYYIGLDKSG